MAKIGSAVGGGVTVMVTCALLSFIYTPEQISEFIGNTTSALTIHNFDNTQPQFIMGNGDIQNNVDYPNGVPSAFDADNPQKPPSGNRPRKPTTAPLNSTADYFQRTMAISKLFYTNEKLSYIRMGMEIASVLIVGVIWRFCFRKQPSVNEEKLKKEVADLQAQLTKLKKASPSSSSLVDPQLVRVQIQETTTRLNTKITSLQEKIIALDTKFEQCYKLFNILYQALKFLYQNVEFKNTNTNTNNNFIMLNLLDGSKGNSSLDNELVETSSGNILKSKNFPRDSFTNASNTTVNTVSIDGSLDSSRNLNSSLLLSPIKKEGSKGTLNSSGMPALIPEENAGGGIPLPSTSKVTSNEIQAAMEDPIVTVEVRATPWRPPMRQRGKKDTSEENSVESATQQPTVAAENTVPANQASAHLEEQQDLIRQLQSKLVLAEETKHQLEASIAEMEEQINTLKNSHEEEKVELEGKISEAQNASVALQTKLATVQTQLQDTYDGLKNATELLLKEKDSTRLLQTQLNELKNQLEEQQKNMEDSAQLQQQLSELQEKYTHLELQHNITETELSALQSEHSSLQSEHNTQCSERIHTMELMADIAKKENETLQAQVAAAISPSEVDQLKAELEDTKITVQMMEDKYEALEKELTQSNNEITRIRLSNLGSVEQQERQYQDSHHQQQIVGELLEKIQQLENEVFELRADAVDGVHQADAETQTETDVDQLAIELQLAEAENFDKTTYIQELESQLQNLQMEQLKNALETQLPHNLEENANAVVDSVSGHEDASTETEPTTNDNQSQTSTPDSKNSDKGKPKKTPSVHDRLYQQAYEHHCPACDLAAQGLPSNVPHTNHSNNATPSPSRTRSLSLSSGKRDNKPPLFAKKQVAAVSSFTRAKPQTTAAKGTTSKTTTPASSRPSSPPPRGRQPSRSLYPTPSQTPQPAPTANLIVMSNEATPHIVPGAPILQPNKKFQFAPSSMNIKKSTSTKNRKRSLSFTHLSTMPADFQPTSPQQ